jgi:uncharacterized membrane protein
MTAPMITLVLLAAPYGILRRINLVSGAGRELRHAAAFGLALPVHRQRPFLLRKGRGVAGWLGAALLVLFFPANVYAAIHHVPQGGHSWGPIYLLVRAPLQLMILFWDDWFVIRSRNELCRIGSCSCL